MQTIYYSTPNFIRHTDNVVDLNEYRRRLTLAQEGSLAPQPQVEEYVDDSFEEAWEAPVLREIKPRRSRSRRNRALMLELCASVSVVVMTLAFTVKILLA